MINKVKLTLIAAIAASSIALPAAALAQSAYTTGTAASRAAAGYSSPYGYGSGLYAYAPRQDYGHSPPVGHSRHMIRFGGFTRLQLAYGGGNFGRTLEPLFNRRHPTCLRKRPRPGSAIQSMSRSS